MRPRAGAAGWGPGSRCDKEGPWVVGGGAAQPCPALKTPAAFREVRLAGGMCHPPPERPLRFGTVLPVCITCHGRMPCMNVRVAFLRASCFFVCLSPCVQTPGSAALPCSSPARLKLAGVLPESGWSYHHHLSPWSPRLRGHKDQHHAVLQVTARCHEGPPNRGWGLSGHFHHPTAPKAFLTLV